MESSETPTTRSRLLARVRREFSVIEEIIEVGGNALRFARIADPDALLGDVCEQVSQSERGIPPKRELRMPYWAAVWESAMALAQHLVERDAEQPLAGRRILDLGCGMGLVGAACATQGARVTLADIDTAALLFARLNTLAWADRARVVRCDWGGGDLGERFDLIAGADLIYDAEQWAPIEAFARRHLDDGGMLLLSEPSRPTADHFARWLDAMGWETATTMRAAGDKRIRIHEARPTPSRA